MAARSEDIQKLDDDRGRDSWGCEDEGCLVDGADDDLGVWIDAGQRSTAM